MKKLYHKKKAEKKIKIKRQKQMQKKKKKKSNTEKTLNVTSGGQKHMMTSGR